MPLVLPTDITTDAMRGLTQANVIFLSDDCSYNQVSVHLVGYKPRENSVV